MFATRGGADDPIKLLGHLVVFDLTAAALFLSVKHARNRDWHTNLVNIAAALGILGSYVSGIYPTLPAWAGGGRPEDVRLVLSEAAAASCVACTEQVRMIDEDSLRIVILVREDGQERAIEISRLEVRLVQHVKPVPR